MYTSTQASDTTYDINNRDRVMAIAAHPDDIEFGCFGTLLKWHGTGSQIVEFIATDGSGGGDPSQRINETLSSAKILNSHVIFGGLPDMQIHYEQAMQKIEDAIDEFKPTVILTHTPNDIHQDHRTISLATLSSARNISNVLFFQSSPSTTTFNPQYFVDITEFIDKKQYAISLHKTQSDKFYSNPDSISTMAKYYAYTLRHAGRMFEAFEVQRMVV